MQKVCTQSNASINPNKAPGMEKRWLMGYMHPVELLNLATKLEEVILILTGR